MSAPDQVDIYWTAAAPLGPLKESFPSLDGASVVITSSRSFILNADYWALVPPARLVTLSSQWPLERRLRVATGDVAEDPLRVLHVVTAYPWDAVDLDLDLVTEHARRLRLQDPAAFELRAGLLGYQSGDVFVNHQKAGGNAL